MQITTTREHTPAQAHRLELIIWRTAEIQAAESAITWDGALLTKLYALRGSHILEALQLGVPSAEISAITGLGA